MESQIKLQELQRQYSYQIQAYWKTEEGAKLLALYFDPELKIAMRVIEACPPYQAWPNPLYEIRPDVSRIMFHAIFGHLFDFRDEQDKIRDMMLQAHLVHLIMLDK